MRLRICIKFVQSMRCVPPIAYDVLIFSFSYIVHFYGACTKEPNLAIVMELMHTSLTNFLHKNKDELAWSVKLGIVEDIAKGIQFLHTNKPTVCRAVK